MSLPRLKPEEAKEFLALRMDERFQNFWKRLEDIMEHWTIEALAVSTPVERREALVRLRETFQVEVMDLPREARNVLMEDERKKKSG